MAHSQVIGGSMSCSAEAIAAYAALILIFLFFVMSLFDGRKKKATTESDVATFQACVDKYDLEKDAQIAAVGVMRQMLRNIHTHTDVYIDDMYCEHPGTNISEVASSKLIVAKKLMDTNKLPREIYEVFENLIYEYARSLLNREGNQRLLTSLAHQLGK